MNRFLLVISISLLLPSAASAGLPDLPTGIWRERNSELTVTISKGSRISITELKGSDPREFSLEVTAVVRREYWTEFLVPDGLYSSDALVFVFEDSLLKLIFLSGGKTVKTLTVYRKS